MPTERALKSPSEIARLQQANPSATDTGSKSPIALIRVEIRSNRIFPSPSVFGYSLL